MCNTPPWLRAPTPFGGISSLAAYQSEDPEYGVRVQYLQIACHTTLKPISSIGLSQYFICKPERRRLTLLRRCIAWPKCTGESLSECKGYSTCFPSSKLLFSVSLQEDSNLMPPHLPGWNNGEQLLSDCLRYRSSCSC